MTPLSMEILADWQVRRTKKQKTAFIDFLRGRLPELQVESYRRAGSRNLILGDLNSAKVVFTAHYDTCAVLPFPNFLTPRNISVYIIYNILIIAVFLFLSVGAGILVERLTNWEDVGHIVYLVVLWALILLMFCGPANRHNANDNTSGVITLLEIYAALSPEAREKCAFVFFDDEENGLLGSARFSKRHKTLMKQKLLINFDCVSDGDDILVVAKRASEQAHGELLREAFTGSDEKRIRHYRSSTTIYPSDQAAFPMGVAVAAFRRAPIIGLYISRIHTPRDTVFDERNIRLIADRACRLISSL